LAGARGELEQAAEGKSERGDSKSRRLGLMLHPHRGAAANASRAEKANTRRGAGGRLTSGGSNDPPQARRTDRHTERTELAKVATVLAPALGVDEKK
jgi:hypothetical protein